MLRIATTLPVIFVWNPSLLPWNWTGTYHLSVHIMCTEEKGMCNREIWQPRSSCLSQNSSCPHKLRLILVDHLAPLAIVLYTSGAYNNLHIVKKQGSRVIKIIQILGMQIKPQKGTMRLQRQKEGSDSVTRAQGHLSFIHLQW